MGRRTISKVDKLELKELSKKAYQFLQAYGLKLPLQEYHQVVTFDLAYKAEQYHFPKNTYIKDIRKLAKTTEDIKLKALCCILLLQHEVADLDELSKETEQVLQALTQFQQGNSPEDLALQCIHGLFLANTLDLQEDFAESNKFLESILLRRGFRDFQKEENIYLFLYYFTQLISEFPYLSFQWRNELCQIIEEPLAMETTLSMSSKAICRELLDITPDDISTRIYYRQDESGCFPYEGTSALPYANVLSTVFAYSALNLPRYSSNSIS